MPNDKHTDWAASLIKISAIVTASPRWVGALLAAEGFALPADWMWWWIPLSALLSVGMAIVEGLAFSYVFNAWRNQKVEKIANNLLGLTLFSTLVFILVLAPYIASAVKHVELAEILAEPALLWAWAFCVALSTITIVGSVGYAQKPAIQQSKVVVQSNQPVVQSAIATESPSGATVVPTIVTKPPRVNATKTKVLELLLAEPTLSTAVVAKRLEKTVEITRQYRNELIKEGKLPAKTV
jgi:hypothetical protein